MITRWDCVWLWPNWVLRYRLSWRKTNQISLYLTCSSWFIHDRWISIYSYSSPYILFGVSIILNHRTSTTFWIISYYWNRASWIFVFFFLIFRNHSSWSTLTYIRFRHRSHYSFLRPCRYRLSLITSWLLPTINNRMSLSYTTRNLRLTLMFIHKFIIIVHSMHLFILSISFFTFSLFYDFILSSFLFSFFGPCNFSFSVSLKFL